MLDSEGDSELGKTVFAYRALPILGRKDNILVQLTLDQHGLELICGFFSINNTVSPPYLQVPHLRIWTANYGT